MDYTIKTHLFGKKQIVFKCDRCHDELMAPLEDAGLQQTCPNCGTPFLTPGTDEMNAEREQQRLKEIETRQRQQREQAEQEERRRQVSIQPPKPPPPPPTPPKMVWYGAMHCNSCGYQWQARRQTPPAKCASCGRRDIEAVKVPERTAGCLIIIAFIIPTALLFAAHSWH